MKLPEITLNDWLEAEKSLSCNLPVQPEGSITSSQYAVMKNCSLSSARDSLSRLYEKKKATREYWRCSKHHSRWVYWLKK